MTKIWRNLNGGMKQISAGIECKKKMPPKMYLLTFQKGFFNAPTSHTLSFIFWLFF